MSRLLESRAAILDALEAGGVNAATTGKFSAPCVLVETGRPVGGGRPLARASAYGSLAADDRRGTADTDGSVRGARRARRPGRRRAPPRARASQLPTWARPFDVTARRRSPTPRARATIQTDSDPRRTAPMTTPLFMRDVTLTLSSSTGRDRRRSSTVTLTSARGRLEPGRRRDVSDALRGRARSARPGESTYALHIVAAQDWVGDRARAVPVGERRARARRSHTRPTARDRDPVRHATPGHDRDRHARRAELRRRGGHVRRARGRRCRAPRKPTLAVAAFPAGGRGEALEPRPRRRRWSRRSVPVEGVEEIAAAFDKLRDDVARHARRRTRRSRGPLILGSVARLTPGPDRRAPRARGSSEPTRDAGSIESAGSRYARSIEYGSPSRGIERGRGWSRATLEANESALNVGDEYAAAILDAAQAARVPR